MADGESSISVAVRVRPFTIREAAQLVKNDDGPVFLGDGSLAAAPPKLHAKGLRSVVRVIDDRCLVFDPPESNPISRFSRSVVPNSKKTKDQTFAFDRVFDDNTTQGDVYEGTTKPLLDNVLDGYNATVFAYGATGCGKTHTITGTPQQPGIIFLTMQELFERLGELHETKASDVSLSYLEIYNETIRDLLVPGGSKAGLTLREDANQAVSVGGLSSHRPKNVEEVMEMLVRGNHNRTMSPTEANATSSRSHAVLQINVSTKDRNASVNEPHTMATLSIIDLAGSERASATKNRGERLVEGANINKSLLALGSCINALCDPRKKNHVPYRNSKLTRLLKFSLGGNCKTVMIVCVSPSSAHYDESQNTLRYANRAKNIQTKVSKNIYNVNRHVKDYLKKIDEQRQLIEEMQAKMKDLEGSAFVKFKKQSEKRDSIAKEGIMRIRSAYENAGAERQDRVNTMKKLRQVERRISMISAWIAGFDTVCEQREDEEPPQSFVTMRKTALGIQAELESTRQHFHQRLAKNNWDRSIDSALQTGIRQLKEADPANCSADVANLMREAELLRANADRETYAAVLEQDRGGDSAVIQMLLQANFEVVTILGQIMVMDEEAAVRAAKEMLGKLVSCCSEAASQVIKPDGGLPVTEAFPPTSRGTPKRRNPVKLVAPSPMKLPVPVWENAYSSPAKSMASPRRRKFNAPRKGLKVTPKKSPSKHVKRGVRWRDDTDDGALVEFQATPQALDYTPPPGSSAEKSVSGIPSLAESLDSSPIPAPPNVASLEVKPVRPNSRFQTGFLSKKPSSPSLLPAFSSDSEREGSPLRELELNKARGRSPLHVSSSNIPSSSEATPNDSDKASATSSDDERSWLHRVSKGDDQNAARKIRTAIKRTSVGERANMLGSHKVHGSTGSARLNTRNNLKSPPTAHARRTSITKGGAPIAGARRVTLSEDRGRVGGLASGQALRLGGARAGGGGSLKGDSKSVWR
ncbi:tubulin-dependent ATPase kip3 [Diplodia intermedia]|uniref:Kinesin-like protein n=1 Tax=Diplodia intermedia TaxID=856260 RepID=A0ABR3U5R5_9PEZI